MLGGAAEGVVGSELIVLFGSLEVVVELLEDSVPDFVTIFDADLEGRIELVVEDRGEVLDVIVGGLIGDIDPDIAVDGVGQVDDEFKATPLEVWIIAVG